MQAIQKKLISYLLSNVADVADIDPNDMSASLLSGNVSLSNVRLRTRRLNALVFGHTAAPAAAASVPADGDDADDAEANSSLSLGAREDAASSSASAAAGPSVASAKKAMAMEFTEGVAGSFAMSIPWLTAGAPITASFADIVVAVRRKADADANAAAAARRRRGEVTAADAEDAEEDAAMVDEGITRQLSREAILSALKEELVLGLAEGSGLMASLRAASQGRRGDGTAATNNKGCGDDSDDEEDAEDDGNDANFPNADDAAPSAASKGEGSTDGDDEEDGDGAFESCSEGDPDEAEGEGSSANQQQHASHQYAGRKRDMVFGLMKRAAVAVVPEAFKRPRPIEVTLTNIRLRLDCTPPTVSEAALTSSSHLASGSPQQQRRVLEVYVSSVKARIEPETSVSMAGTSSSSSATSTQKVKLVEVGEVRIQGYVGGDGAASAASAAPTAIITVPTLKVTLTENATAPDNLPPLLVSTAKAASSGGSGQVVLDPTALATSSYLAASAASAQPSHTNNSKVTHLKTSRMAINIEQHSHIVVNTAACGLNVLRLCCLGFLRADDEGKSGVARLVTVPHRWQYLVRKVIRRRREARRRYDFSLERLGERRRVRAAYVDRIVGLARGDRLQFFAFRDELCSMEMEIRFRDVVFALRRHAHKLCGTVAMLHDGGSLAEISSTSSGGDNGASSSNMRHDTLVDGSLLITVAAPTTVTLSMAGVSVLLPGGYAVELGGVKVMKVGELSTAATITAFKVTTPLPNRPLLVYQSNPQLSFVSFSLDTPSSVSDPTSSIGTASSLPSGGGGFAATRAASPSPISASSNITIRNTFVDVNIVLNSLVVAITGDDIFACGQPLLESATHLLVAATAAERAYRASGLYVSPSVYALVDSSISQTADATFVRGLDKVKGGALTVTVTRTSIAVKAMQVAVEGIGFSVGDAAAVLIMSNGSKGILTDVKCAAVSANYGEGPTSESLSTTTHSGATAAVQSSSSSTALLQPFSISTEPRSNTITISPVVLCLTTPVAKAALALGMRMQTLVPADLIALLTQGVTAEAARRAEAGFVGDDATTFAGLESMSTATGVSMAGGGERTFAKTIARQRLTAAISPATRIVGALFEALNRSRRPKRMRIEGIATIRELQPYVRRSRYPSGIIVTSVSVSHPGLVDLKVTAISVSHHERYEARESSLLRGDDDEEDGSGGVSVPSITVTGAGAAMSSASRQKKRRLKDAAIVIAISAIDASLFEDRMVVSLQRLSAEAVLLADPGLVNQVMLDSMSMNMRDSSEEAYDPVSFLEMRDVRAASCAGHTDVSISYVNVCGKGALVENVALSMVPRIGATPVEVKPTVTGSMDLALRVKTLDMRCLTGPRFLPLNTILFNQVIPWATALAPPRAIRLFMSSMTDITVTVREGKTVLTSYNGLVALAEVCSADAKQHSQPKKGSPSSTLASGRQSAAPSVPQSARGPSPTFSLGGGASGHTSPARGGSAYPSHCMPMPTASSAESMVDLVDSLIPKRFKITVFNDPDTMTQSVTVSNAILILHTPSSLSCAAHLHLPSLKVDTPIARMPYWTQCPPLLSQTTIVSCPMIQAAFVACSPPSFAPPMGSGYSMPAGIGGIHGARVVHSSSSANSGGMLRGALAPPRSIIYTSPTSANSRSSAATLLPSAEAVSGANGGSTPAEDAAPKPIGYVPNTRRHQSVVSGSRLGKAYLSLCPSRITVEAHASTVKSSEVHSRPTMMTTTTAVGGEGTASSPARRARLNSANIMKATPSPSANDLSVIGGVGGATSDADDMDSLYGDHDGGAPTAARSATAHLPPMKGGAIATNANMATSSADGLYGDDGGAIGDNGLYVDGALADGASAMLMEDDMMGMDGDIDAGAIEDADDAYDDAYGALYGPSTMLRTEDQSTSVDIGDIALEWNIYKHAELKAVQHCVEDLLAVFTDVREPLVFTPQGYFRLSNDEGGARRLSQSRIVSGVVYDLTKVKIRVASSAPIPWVAVEEEESAAIAAPSDGGRSSPLNATARPPATPPPPPTVDTSMPAAGGDDGSGVGGLVVFEDCAFNEDPTAQQLASIRVGPNATVLFRRCVFYIPGCTMALLKRFVPSDSDTATVVYEACEWRTRLDTEGHVDATIPTGPRQRLPRIIAPPPNAPATAVNSPSESISHQPNANPQQQQQQESGGGADDFSRIKSTVVEASDDFEGSRGDGSDVGSDGVANGSIFGIRSAKGSCVGSDAAEADMVAVDARTAVALKIHCITANFNINDVGPRVCLAMGPLGLNTSVHSTQQPTDEDGDGRPTRVVVITDTVNKVHLEAVSAACEVIGRRFDLIPSGSLTVTVSQHACFTREVSSSVALETDPTDTDVDGAWAMPDLHVPMSLLDALTAYAEVMGGPPEQREGSEALLRGNLRPCPLPSSSASAAASNGARHHSGGGISGPSSQSARNEAAAEVLAEELQLRTAIGGSGWILDALPPFSALEHLSIAFKIPTLQVTVYLPTDLPLAAFDLRQLTLLTQRPLKSITASSAGGVGSNSTNAAMLGGNASSAAHSDAYHQGHRGMGKSPSSTSHQGGTSPSITMASSSSRSAVACSRTILAFMWSVRVYDHMQKGWTRLIDVCNAQLEATRSVTSAAIAVKLLPLNVSVSSATLRSMSFVGRFLEVSQRRNYNAIRGGMMAPLLKELQGQQRLQQQQQQQQQEQGASSVGDRTPNTANANSSSNVSNVNSCFSSPLSAHSSSVVGPQQHGPMSPTNSTPSEAGRGFPAVPPANAASSSAQQSSSAAAVAVAAQQWPQHAIINEVGCPIELFFEDRTSVRLPLGGQYKAIAPFAHMVDHIAVGNMRRVPVNTFVDITTRRYASAGLVPSPLANKQADLIEPHLLNVPIAFTNEDSNVLFAQRSVTYVGDGIEVTIERIMTSHFTEEIRVRSCCIIENHSNMHFVFGVSCPLTTSIIPSSSSHCAAENNNTINDKQRLSSSSSGGGRMAATNTNTNTINNNANNTINHNTSSSSTDLIPQTMQQLRPARLSVPPYSRVGVPLWLLDDWSVSVALAQQLPPNTAVGHNSTSHFIGGSFRSISQEIISKGESSRLYTKGFDMRTAASTAAAGGNPTAAPSSGAPLPPSFPHSSSTAAAANATIGRQPSTAAALQPHTAYASLTFGVDRSTRISTVHLHHATAGIRNGMRFAVTATFYTDGGYFDEGSRRGCYVAEPDATVFTTSHSPRERLLVVLEVKTPAGTYASAAVPLHPRNLLYDDATPCKLFKVPEVVEGEEGGVSSLPGMIGSWLGGFTGGSSPAPASGSSNAVATPQQQQQQPKRQVDSSAVARNVVDTITTDFLQVYLFTGTDASLPILHIGPHPDFVYVINRTSHSLRLHPFEEEDVIAGMGEASIPTAATVYVRAGAYRFSTRETLPSTTISLEPQLPPSIIACTYTTRSTLVCEKFMLQQMAVGAAPCSVLRTDPDSTPPLPFKTSVIEVLSPYVIANGSRTERLVVESRARNRTSNMGGAALLTVVEPLGVAYLSRCSHERKYVNEFRIAFASPATAPNEAPRLTTSYSSFVTDDGVKSDFVMVPLGVTCKTSGSSRFHVMRIVRPTVTGPTELFVGEAGPPPVTIINATLNTLSQCKPHQVAHCGLNTLDPHLLLHRGKRCTTTMTTAAVYPSSGGGDGGAGISPVPSPTSPPLSSMRWETLRIGVADTAMPFAVPKASLSAVKEAEAVAMGAGAEAARDYSRLSVGGDANKQHHTSSSKAKTAHSSTEQHRVEELMTDEDVEDEAEAKRNTAAADYVPLYASIKAFDCPDHLRRFVLVLLPPKTVDSTTAAAGMLSGSSRKAVSLAGSLSEDLPSAVNTADGAGNTTNGPTIVGASDMSGKNNGSAMATRQRTDSLTVSFSVTACCVTVLDYPLRVGPSCSVVVNAASGGSSISSSSSGGHNGANGTLMAELAPILKLVVGGASVSLKFKRVDNAKGGKHHSHSHHQQHPSNHSHVNSSGAYTTSVWAATPSAHATTTNLCILDVNVENLSATDLTAVDVTSRESVTHSARTALERCGFNMHFMGLDPPVLHSELRAQSCTVATSPMQLALTERLIACLLQFSKNAVWTSNTLERRFIMMTSTASAPSPSSCSMAAAQRGFGVPWKRPAFLQCKVVGGGDGHCGVGSSTAAAAYVPSPIRSDATVKYVSAQSLCLGEVSFVISWEKSSGGDLIDNKVLAYLLHSVKRMTIVLPEFRRDRLHRAHAEGLSSELMWHYIHSVRSQWRGIIASFGISQLSTVTEGIGFIGGKVLGLFSSALRGGGKDQPAATAAGGAAAAPTTSSAGGLSNFLFGERLSLNDGASAAPSSAAAGSNSNSSASSHSWLCLHCHLIEELVKKASFEVNQEAMHDLLRRYGPVVFIHHTGARELAMVLSKSTVVKRGGAVAATSASSSSSVVAPPPPTTYYRMDSVQNLTTLLPLIRLTQLRMRGVALPRDEVGHEWLEGVPPRMLSLRHAALVAGGQGGGSAPLPTAEGLAEFDLSTPAVATIILNSGLSSSSSSSLGSSSAALLHQHAEVVLQWQRAFVKAFLKNRVLTTDPPLGGGGGH